jgi:hypothetical protein
MEPTRPISFHTLADMAAAGFQGAQRISELQQSKCKEVPGQPGVYVIQRPRATDPTYLPESIGRHFKGRNPTLPTAVLASQWVPESCVVYIGKASRQTLRERLRQYMDFGLGKAVGHRGGRYIWQLQDSGELLVSWKATSGTEAALLESHLIQMFKAQHGRRPFANLRD